MCPSAAVDALGSTEGGQSQHRAVDLVSMVEVVDTRTEDDLRTTVRIDRILRKFATNTDCRISGNTGEFFLPCGSSGGRGIGVVGRPHAGKARARNTILSEHEIVHGGDKLATDATNRNASGHNASTNRRGRSLVCDQVESRKADLNGLATFIVEGQTCVDALHGEVPLALTLIGVTIRQGSARVTHSTRLVHDKEAEFGVRAVTGFLIHGLGNVSNGEELAGNQALGGLIQFQKEGRVRVAEHVILETLGRVLDVEFLEDHVAHGHCKSAVGTGVHAKPLIGKLRVVRVVGSNRNDLLAVVAGLGHEVSIRGTGQRQV